MYGFGPQPPHLDPHARSLRYWLDFLALNQHWSGHLDKRPEGGWGRAHEHVPAAGGLGAARRR